MLILWLLAFTCMNCRVHCFLLANAGNVEGDCHVTKAVLAKESGSFTYLGLVFGSMSIALYCLVSMLSHISHKRTRSDQSSVPRQLSRRALLMPRQLSRRLSRGVSFIKQLVRYHILMWNDLLVPISTAAIVLTCPQMCVVFVRAAICIRFLWRWKPICVFLQMPNIYGKL